MAQPSQVVFFPFFNRNESFRREVHDPSRRVSVVFFGPSKFSKVKFYNLFSHAVGRECNLSFLRIAKGPSLFSNENYQIADAFCICPMHATATGT